MGDSGDGGIELEILVTGMCAVVSHTLVQSEEEGRKWESRRCAHSFGYMTAH